MAKNLIAVLGIGKGTWGHVARIINEQDFEKIVLISNEWGKENFKPEKECEWVLINNRAPFDVLVKEIKEKLPEGNVSVNLASGTGKEHMALLVALKQANKDFEIVTLTGEGLKYY
jgi:hypothetical protein